MLYDDNLHRIWMMAITAWREARSETEEGIIAVMFTMKERVQNKVKWEGGNYVEVVTKSYQYSSISDPHDKQLILFPQEGDSRFHKMLELADKVIAGAIPNPVPGADSYFADWISAPKWATQDKFIKKIGHHLFYRVL